MSLPTGRLAACLDGAAALYYDYGHMYHKERMMKSVRLDADLESKLERAARALATSQSEFIRDALARRCDEVLGGSLAQRLVSVIGIVKSSGGRATRSGPAFRAALATRRARRGGR
jgi:predicted DNA-binding protein